MDLIFIRSAMSLNNEQPTSDHGLLQKIPPSLAIERRRPPCPANLASMSIPSLHLDLGLTRPLYPFGRPKKFLRAVLSSAILMTCPAHRSRESLMRCATVRSPYNAYNSALYRLLHRPTSHTGPNILLSTLLSNAVKRASSVLDSVQVSEAYVNYPLKYLMLIL